MIFIHILPVINWLYIKFQLHFIYYLAYDIVVGE